MIVATGLLATACGQGDSGAAGGSPAPTGGTTATTEAASAGGDSGAGGTEVSTGDTGAGSTATTASPETTATPDTTVAPETTSPVTTGPALSPAKEGDKGDGVVAIQQRLADLGFGITKPDGAYGRKTAAAVKAFQMVAGLEETGEADAATVAALGTYNYTGTVLHAGDEGPAVADLQNRLAGGPFDPGPADGKFGTKTIEAVWALSKLADLPVDDNWGPLDEKAWEMLTSGAIGQPTQSHTQRWVEVDLSEQLMKVYDPGATAPVLISHISSGSGQHWENEGHSGNSITPKGNFAISRRISGWRESSLDIGRLYNPLYFTGGIALHGALSVPLYPASHGCVRVPMHIAEYLPGELPNGTPVDVLA
ncbi:MAG: peptidoglycan-binding protein [Acidimicrobiales bacterium]